MEDGFHQIPSLPGVAATIAWPMPTACAPVGSSRNNAASLPCPEAGAAASASETRLERSSLIDQHNGNIVADRIAKLALLADQRLLRLSILQLALALRADENLQQPR